MIYDTIIIGSGPAGMTAGIYAARREMKTLIIGKDIGGQVALAGKIENYPGFKSIDNYDLIVKMQEQVMGLGVEMKSSEVKEIKKENDEFIIKTGKDEFKAKTVIVAMGLTPRRLAIPGEEEFAGKGISYCANCDGMFFKGKDVAVVGGGNSAFDAAEVMSKIANSVHLINHSDKFKAFDVLVDKVKEKDNVEIITNSEVKEIKGNDKVEKILINNKKTGKKKEISINGVFIEIGRIAHTDMLEGLVKMDERSQIIVNDKCRTDTEGIFAAGDVTTVPFKQITIACGQATIAALAAYQYLQTK
jgi:thioredoxin-disulfide reductase